MKKKRKIKIAGLAPILIGQRTWYCVGFEYTNENMGDFFHIALIYDQDVQGKQVDVWQSLVKALCGKEILLRIHSECILGDVFDSSLCDCAEQRDFGLSQIEKLGTGIFIYLRQEGRGIGLRAKLKCLALQEGYIDNVYTGKIYTPDEANLALGFAVDERDYDIVPRFLELLKIKKVKLISGNPDKINTLRNSGIGISQLIDIPRRSVKRQSRKFIELEEKVFRNYIYSIK